MVNSKLTLKLNSDSISRAKNYSQKNKISLSAMVENFFDSLTLQKSNDNTSSFSPLVSELSGIINLSENFDYKSDYREQLESKYE